MEVESVLVTGANSGIGLEFVKELVELPNPPRFVFATYRNENKTQALKEIRDSYKETKVVLIKMDVTEEAEIADARKIIESKVGDIGLGLLINNAGAVIQQKFPKITKENMLFHFCTNTVGPVMVFQEMLPLLQKSAARKANGMKISRSAVLNISSVAGSIAGRFEEITKRALEPVGYRISKAALNMAMRIAAVTVKDPGILVVNMCPGMTKTAICNTGIEASESVSSMLKTLPQLNESHHGAFLDRYGKPIPF